MGDLPSPLSRFEVMEQLDQLGFRFQRKRGQNFLFDENLLKALVRDSGVVEGDRVLEVGTGAGTLTRALLEVGCHVTTVEIDPILCQFLRQHLTHPCLRLIEADALDSKNRIAEQILTSLDSMADCAAAGFQLVANLPYSIASPLVAMLVSERPDLQRIGVLVQREVADRWLASPGTREYGTATVLLALTGEGKIARKVPAHAFVPAPRVESAFYTWTRTDSGQQLPGNLVQLVRSCFRQRRKTLRKILKDWLEADDPWWQEMGVDPATRPDQLSPRQWESLARKIGDSSSLPR
ncbi:MAG: ribosomal RNA small subunit methyltransferase A [Planctomycetes bacterium]|nr:ribosomal RNA small subunit methyltransferase A [Planctomycetota bacterium]